MALAIGTRLGPYEITGTLGAGGMGEVYRATDSELKRDVAIKVLPESLADDADRLARFRREAELLASLNHPNVAQIYGLERSDGTTAFVMELVEGPTLADRIAQGAIPPDEALHMAMQIADALEAAHGRQMIHRDLKPANIKLTADGTVKVLDFGIAKALETQRGTSGPQTPSLTTPAMTQAGILLGTAAYMSPEQARGKAVDQRADIWAFGCVLYEMLTGQPAFAGEDVPTTLARVLANDTDMKSIPGTVSPAVRQTIKLCLQKNVQERPSDIRDVKLALKGAFETEPQSTADNLMTARPFWRRALPVTVGVLVSALATGLAAWAVMRPGTPKLARFDMTPSGGVTVAANSTSVAVSPDGQLIAYLVGDSGAGGSGAGGKELRLRRLNQLGSSTLVVADQGGITSPFFSPDGTQVGFEAFISSAVLKRVSTQGGPASTITELPGDLKGASWGADGTIIYGTSGTASPTGLWRVRATGGTPEMLTKPDSESGVTSHSWPEILLSGKAVLFAMTNPSEQDSKIAVFSLATGEQRVLLSNGVSPHYSPTGHLLFGRAGTLFAVGFDAARLQIDGDPVPVQQGVMSKGPLGGTETSLASNGTLVYVSGTQATARHLVWVDSEGHETPVSTPPRPYDQVVLSPDGTHAAVGIEGDKSVWIADLKRGTLERLPADLGDRDPSVLFFSADGRRVASSAVRDGRQEVVWQPIDGTGGLELLATFGASVTAVMAGAPSPDGKRFVLNVLQHGRGDLGIVTVSDPKSFRDFLATPAFAFGPAISPDGNWMAYSSSDTGNLQVYVQRFPEGGARLPVSISGGVFPHWSADGAALTYWAEGGSEVRVPVMGLGAPARLPTFGTPTKLFLFKYFNLKNGTRPFDMTADGGRFLVITDPQVANAKRDSVGRLVLVQNWFEELKRLVPTK